MAGSPSRRSRTRTGWLALALAAAAGAATGDPQPGFEARRYTGHDGRSIPYRLFVPRLPDGAPRPILVLWLHGLEGRGTDNARQIDGDDGAALGILSSDSVQRERPALIVVPQCPPDRAWTTADGSASEELHTALELVESLLESPRYRIAQRRIYVGGRSMGEDGARALIAQRPYLVASLRVTPR